MAKADFLGYTRCGLCSSDKARVSLTKRGLCCVTCHACQCQLFARSDHSDMHIRRNLRAVDPEPAPNTSAAASARPEPVAVPPAGVAASPGPAGAGSSWDIW